MTGAELRSLRARLGLTQDQLRQAIDYQDVMSVSRWERDVNPIPQVVAMAVTHLTCSQRPGRRKTPEEK